MRKTVEKLAREAGKIILSAAEDKGVEEKSSVHDLVTIYDKQVQEFLSRELLTAVPEAGFYGEEDAAHDGSDKPYRFIVDPIDGTTNFVKGLGRSCVSIGLEQKGEILLGVIYDPYKDELFSAEKGKGATLNGRPIHVSNDALCHSVAYTGASPYYPELMDRTFSLARMLAERCIDIRRSGSAALELCDVACGRAGAYYELRLSPWDYAAGSLILQEAGGVITDTNGKPLQYQAKSGIAASNAACREEFMNLMLETK